MNSASVIFDLDGTLIKPGLDFDAIRKEIGVEGPILEAVAALEVDARKTAKDVLQRYEQKAARNSSLQDGALEIVESCRRLGMSVAILTRNSRASVDVVLKTHGIVVDALRTRDDGAIKPSPEPIRSICSELGTDPRQSWMVGDYLFDIQSGQAAGATTVLMLGDRPLPDYAHQADHVIRQLGELTELLDGAKHNA